jgi:hypothetical protein
MYVCKMLTSFEVTCHLLFVYLYLLFFYLLRVLVVKLPHRLEFRIRIVCVDQDPESLIEYSTNVQIFHFFVHLGELSQGGSGPV